MDAKILLLTPSIHQRTHPHTHTCAYMHIIDTHTQCTYIHNHTCAYTICVQYIYMHICAHNHVHTYVCTHHPYVYMCHIYTHLHTQSHTMHPTAVSIHCRKGHVYQALELPWDCRGCGLLRHLSPFNGCRNLLSPQPSFCQSPSVKEWLCSFLSGTLSDCGKKIAFSDRDLRNAFPENSAQIN